MPPEPTFLKVAEVSKSYGGVLGAPPVRVLESINLEIAAGESVAIVGPSGSGKSTLLNIIGTLDRPTQGQVFLQGLDLTTLDPIATAQVRNRRLGFIFQAHHLLPQCSVLENVLIPTLALPARERAQTEERARRLLERVALTPRLAHRPGQLSGGERQRVAVVRALINQPQLLLADEPTGSLDHTAAAELSQLLVDLNREEQLTLLIVTHSLDLAKRMQRVLLLRDGKLKESTSHPAERRDAAEQTQQ